MALELRTSPSNIPFNEAKKLLYGGKIDLLIRETPWHKKTLTYVLFEGDVLPLETYEDMYTARIIGGRDPERTTLYLGIGLNEFKKGLEKYQIKLLDISI